MPSSPLSKVLLVAGWSLFLLTGTLPSIAQEKTTPQATSPIPEKTKQANAECFACHSEEGMKNLPAKEGLDPQKLKGLLQNPEHYYTADHQKQLCTKCHSEGYDDFPHEANAKESTGTCTDCHSKKANLIEKQFDKSVHAELSDKITCTTCHNPHLMRVSDKQSDVQKTVAQDNRVCLNCHDSEERFAKFAPEKKKRPQIDELHDWLPNTRLHWKAVRCVECHTPAVAAGEMLSHEILSKDKAEKNCLTCHSANSTLKSRLYRHLVKEEQEKYGFAHSVILAKSYVLGATRHPLLDTLILCAFGAMIFGLLAHGIGRIIAHLRRRKNHD